METAPVQSKTQTAVRTDLGAIFVSLELSRSTWLVTSLSPGNGEKMSKHAVDGGDVAGLLDRFAQLQQKAGLRTGRSFPIVTIQEAGLDGFWIHRVLEANGIESYVVDAASIATSRRRRRAKTDKIDGEALVRALLAFKRGEPSVCAMVKAPSPEDEDPRRICRERSVDCGTGQACQSRQRSTLRPGRRRFQPLRKDRRKRLEELQTGDGRGLPRHLKTQINRELDRLELLLEQIAAVESERNSLLAAHEEQAAKGPAEAAMLLSLKVLALSLPPFFGPKGCVDILIIGDRLPPMQVWRLPLGRAGPSAMNKGSRKQAIRDCAPQ